jgi:acetyl esterase/lipase
LCIHVGQREVLCDQVPAFADKAKASGVPVELLVGEDMVHVGHALAGLQPESDAAIAQVGAFLRARRRADAKFRTTLRNRRGLV